MKINETNLSFGSMSRRSATKRIILHHAEASNCTVQDIHRWHLNNGWSGIGYHFFVRKDGLYTADGRKTLSALMHPVLIRILLGSALRAHI